MWHSDSFVVLKIVAYIEGEKGSLLLAYRLTNAISASGGLPSGEVGVVEYGSDAMYKLRISQTPQADTPS
jgi:hypothetical protein